MIPKIIHYCWFGRNPLPELAVRCIASWRKFLPDYEIREWNEDNFDVNIIPYTAEAYKQKKYAFVSDYARFWILYRFGGIYFDTDVEVIRPMDDIIARGNFMGFEQDPDGENTPGKYAPRYCFAVNPGVGFGVSIEHPFIHKMLDKYDLMEFEMPTLPWGKTIVAYTTEVLVEDGLRNIKGIQNVDDITIYPHEFFAPIDVITGRLHITENTYTIHCYMGSWGENGTSYENDRSTLVASLAKNVNDNVNDNHNDNENQNKRKRINVNYLKNKLKRALPEWVFYLNNRIKRRKYRIK